MRRRVGCSTAVLALVTSLMTACAGVPGDARQDYRDKIVASAVGFDMVWVPEGRFWIARTEVTWDAYLLYCDFDETGRVPPGVDAVAKPSKPLEDSHPFDREWGTGERPAVGMSRNGARKFCRWLTLNTGHTYRLPTEAEWELACGPAPVGNIGDYAWHMGNAEWMTHEVGSKKPNARGLHDMLGNLWEYCEGAFSAQELDRAVLRGGAWSSQPGDISPASRLGFDDDWILDDPNVPSGVWWVPHGEHLGFRVVRPAREQ
ncbi:MAG: hypothetical protein CMJ85_00050 [Planctomycetes bacterium]|nr:hypothetical protein [Planctomycetota bacterium]